MNKLTRIKKGTLLVVTFNEFHIFANHGLPKLVDSSVDYYCVVIDTKSEVVFVKYQMRIPNPHEGYSYKENTLAIDILEYGHTFFSVNSYDKIAFLNGENHREVRITGVKDFNPVGLTI